MRIHSSVLTHDDFTNAATLANVRVIKCDPKGSRSRAGAFDFALSGSGVNGGMYGNLDYPTATWDEWGIVLNHLFTVDPDARIPRVYEDAEHFDFVTCGRYSDLTPAECCKRHKWTFNHNIAGVYSVFDCNKCGSERINLYGKTWAQFSGKVTV